MDAVGCKNRLAQALLLLTIGLPAGSLAADLPIPSVNDAPGDGEPIPEKTLPPPIQPADPWLTLQNLLDLPDWLQLGVQVQAAPMVNPIGGSQTSSNWIQQSIGSLSLGSGLSKDPSKWEEIDHWRFDASVNYYNGYPFYAQQIGASLNLQQESQISGFWPTQAQISRSAGNGWFGFKAGILSFNPDFIYAPIYDYYTHASINNVLSLSVNDMPVNPLAGVGGVVEIKPAANLSLRYGIFDIASVLATARLFGANGPTSFIGTGMVQLLQLSYTPEWLGPAKGTALPVCVQGLRITRLHGNCATPATIESQLPSGLIQIGGYTSSYSRDGSAVNGTLSFSTGLPLGIDHRFWIGSNYSFDTYNDSTPMFAGGGLVIQGLIPTRPFDMLVLGGGRSGFNPLIAPQQNYEAMLELGYQYQLNPTLNLQPAVQWIFNPGGGSNLPGIFATTLQLTLNL
jgi:porin